MVTRNGLIALAGLACLALALLSSRAHAADQPAIDCKLIRALVKIETPEKLEREARAGGASEEQIRRAKACLK